MIREEREKEILDAIQGAREMQEFFWREESEVDILSPAWIAMFEKRVRKIKEIDRGRPGWKPELRKRLIQQAALSIKMLEVLNRDKA